MSDSADITRLLRRARDDAAAEDRLYALIYDELRGVARNQLRAERAVPAPAREIAAARAELAGG